MHSLWQRWQVMMGIDVSFYKSSSNFNDIVYYAIEHGNMYSALEQNTVKYFDAVTAYLVAGGIDENDFSVKGAAPGYYNVLFFNDDAFLMAKMIQ